MIHARAEAAGDRSPECGPPGLSLWEYTALRSNVVRKAGAIASQLPRAVVRLSSAEEDYRRVPPVVANAFPKSGTHLLLQILRAFTSRHYGSFIASMPSVTFRERSAADHLRLIGHIVPGELVGAHLFYDERHAEALAGRNAVHFFIYRDLRDVAVSEAHYLTYMNRWHRMHRHFAARLTTEDERLSATILGVSEPGFAYDYPNIAHRFARYQGWLGREDVFAVRFEDLVSPARRTDVVRQMALFYTARGGRVTDVDGLTRAAIAQIDPRRSPTFRVGQPGSWRTAMGCHHLAAVEHAAGALLDQLGYGPTDAGWRNVR